MMKVDPMMVEATYLRRLNRFSCLVNIKGDDGIVYLPNSGRLENILVPGQTIFLVEKSHSSRRTRYDLAMAYVGKTLVSVDSRVPAELFDEAIREKRLARFDGYSVVRREAAFCRSRLDFLLGGQNRQGVRVYCYGCRVILEKIDISGGLAVCM